MAYTLEEIAAMAGVSRSTVSRVINDQPKVDAATRARVWQVVREHDFRPNSAARALVRRHSQVIGLIIPQASSSPQSPAQNGAIVWIGRCGPSI